MCFEKNYYLSQSDLSTASNTSLGIIKSKGLSKLLLIYKAAVAI